MLGPDRVVWLVVASIVVGASFVSALADATGSAGPTGGPFGDGAEPRIAVGGPAGPSRDQPTGRGDTFERLPDTMTFRPVQVPDLDMTPGPVPRTTTSGLIRDDGTLLKPVAVDTSVEDGRDLLRTHRVEAGDTLTGIASKFGVSMMTLWWANDLASKDDLQVGQILTIPPASGLVVTVSSGDTLESLARKYGVDTSAIVDANNLQDPVLVIGQVLILPGAIGSSIPTPKPVVSTSGGSARPPTTNGDGRFVWPVAGGNNYVSQQYTAGHGGLDIAADYGSKVRAATRGTIVFAGWKNNGGGYQVWIAHGSGLYTTYNHMSAVSVGRGQTVSRGQQVGRVGSSGNSTGSHLHFEVWRGQIWNGGSRVNPMRYY
jgi:murein DD-endopeptidase MepM/ murein hydrolase activator NlpD